MWKATQALSRRGPQGASHYCPAARRASCLCSRGVRRVPCVQCHPPCSGYSDRDCRRHTRRGQPGNVGVAGRLTPRPYPARSILYILLRALLSGCALLAVVTQCSLWRASYLADYSQHAHSQGRGRYQSIMAHRRGPCTCSRAVASVPACLLFGVDRHARRLGCISHGN